MISFFLRTKIIEIFFENLVKLKSFLKLKLHNLCPLKCFKWLTWIMS